MPLADFEYHGAIVVVEMATDEIVFVHPGAKTENEPASLPASPCPPAESPRDCAVRIVREMTGLRSRSRESSPPSSKRERRPGRCTPMDIWRDRPAASWQRLGPTGL